MARVDADLLDQLLNNAGEVSIFGAPRAAGRFDRIQPRRAVSARSRVLKEQLRKLEIETEAQILHRYERSTGGRADFDPLELDRYSTIQQLSRAPRRDRQRRRQHPAAARDPHADTAEPAAAAGARGHRAAERPDAHAHGAVPAPRTAPRRIVRQAAADTGKQAELVVDRGVRRARPAGARAHAAAVRAHAAQRRRARHRDAGGAGGGGKPEMGTSMSACAAKARRSSSRSPTTARHDVQAIREGRRSSGLIQPGSADLSDNEALQLILEPGFSTASSVTQHAGRGVGMDVVATEIKKLGGALHMESKHGRARASRSACRSRWRSARRSSCASTTSSMRCRCPRSKASARCRARKSLRTCAEHASLQYSYGGQVLPVPAPRRRSSACRRRFAGEDVRRCPVVLVRAGEHSTGLVTDELIGSREIVVKSGRSADREHPRRLGRHDPGRRPHRHHPRHQRAGARGLARAPPSRARRPRCAAGRSRWSSTTRSPCAA
jgi:chemosensory pili system protein ChpA (sensor histidine kinase/response regulator)